MVGFRGEERMRRLVQEAGGVLEIVVLIVGVDRGRSLDGYSHRGGGSSVDLSGHYTSPGRQNSIYQ